MLLCLLDLVQLAVEIQQLFLGEFHIHHAAHQGEHIKNAHAGLHFHFRIMFSKKRPAALLCAHIMALYHILL